MIARLHEEKKPEPKPTLWQKFGNWMRGGYSGIKQSKNRQSAEKNLVGADRDLREQDRDKAISRARQHQKDFSVAAWMVRKHLDFIAEQNLIVKTGDKELDKDVEAALAEAGNRRNFDVREMHSLASFTRLAESSAVVDGDIFAQKLRSGHIQTIEADRVRNPSKPATGKRYFNGCEVDKAGRIKAVHVFDRADNLGDFDNKAHWHIAYKNVFHHGYFQRHDQYRGISDLISSFNDLQDVYENKGYGLAKSKVAQMFGLALYRQDNPGDGDTPDPTKGAIVLEMAAEDKAEFLTDKNPSTEWKAFMDMVIGMALKSLDIPFSFYMEDFTNFFGSKSALILYLKSCVAKRRNLRDRLLNPWTDWQIEILKAMPEWRRLRQFEKVNYKWVALGTPWANPLQEVQASIMEIGMGLSSRRRKVLEVYGEDVFDIIDEIAEEEDYMREAGVEITYPSQLLPQSNIDSNEGAAA